MIVGIDHIGIAVKKIGEGLKIFEEILGFRIDKISILPLSLIYTL